MQKRSQIDAKEMFPCLIAFILAVDLYYIPGIHMLKSQFRESIAVLWPPWALCPHGELAYRQHVHMHNIKSQVLSTVSNKILKITVNNVSDLLPYIQMLVSF